MTTQKPDGGPAFPQCVGVGTDGNIIASYDFADGSGLSLRDYFAGQVIAQCQITITRGEDEPDPALVAAYAYRYARTAYAIADAMLLERAK